MVEEFWVDGYWVEGYWVEGYWFEGILVEKVQEHKVMLWLGDLGQAGCRSKGLWIIESVKANSKESELVLEYLIGSQYKKELKLKA